MSFISWFLFVIFSGIGLTALPMDLIYDFRTRPVRLNQSEMQDKKTIVLRNTKKVIELAEECNDLVNNRQCLKKSGI